MEDAWKIKIPLPCSEMPLNTRGSGMFMEDGRENEKKSGNL